MNKEPLSPHQWRMESVHLLWVTYLINQHTISGFAKGPLVTHVLLYILIAPSNSGARLVFLNHLILHPKDNFYSWSLTHALLFKIIL